MINEEYINNLMESHKASNREELEAAMKDLQDKLAIGLAANDIVLNRPHELRGTHSVFSTIYIMEKEKPFYGYLYTIEGKDFSRAYWLDIKQTTLQELTTKDILDMATALAKKAYDIPANEDLSAQVLLLYKQPNEENLAYTSTVEIQNGRLVAVRTQDTPDGARLEETIFLDEQCDQQTKQS